MKDLLPYFGDRKARKAWDDIFSRDMLGSVILGGATGKFVENLVALSVLVLVGPDAGAFFEVAGYLAAWSVAIPVGIYVFAYWHRIEETASDAVESVSDSDG